MPVLDNLIWTSPGANSSPDGAERLGQDDAAEFDRRLGHADLGEITVAGQRLDRLNSGRLARWRADNVGFVFQFYN